jgi:hypothetical protein
MIVSAVAVSMNRRLLASGEVIEQRESQRAALQLADTQQRRGRPHHRE